MPKVFMRSSDTADDSSTLQSVDHSCPPSPPRATRKILQDKSLGECCEACYYDVQDSSSICTTCEFCSQICAWCVRAC